jgi:hypothetical protein
MRASLLPLALAASPILASPASPDAPFKVEPNMIEILGGDFGLPSTAINTEVWNQVSMIIASFQGSSDPQASAAVASSIIGLLGQSFGNVASSFGNELTRWLSEQAKFWAFGTDDLDTTNVICSLWENPEVLLSGMFKSVGPPARKGERCRKSLDGGTGPFKANYSADPSFAFRTIYAPLVAPPVSMPIVAWTGCISAGTLYNNMLTEIASHGYLVVTTGVPDQISGSTVVSDTTRNIDWATSQAAKKYGNIDTTKVVVAGHSCGGLEALSATYKDPRVKLTVLFDSAIADPPKRVRLGELKTPLAYFYGGSADLAYKEVSHVGFLMTMLICDRLKPTML